MAEHPDRTRGVPGRADRRAGIVTLLTDFGAADGFVAAMKGVILSADPSIPIVDVSHQIAPQDVRAAAFTLLTAYTAFPPGTVHVAVVDPGVGSPRRPILVHAAEQWFVGPDNGLFGWILEREPGARTFHLDEPRFFRHPVGTTFHGRDVFAPVAAAVATGARPPELGSEIGDPVRLPALRPRRLPDGRVEATVLHIDRFGNCITSLTRDEVAEIGGPAGMRLHVGSQPIRSLRRFYAEPAGQPDEPFAIWGSAGFLELSVDRGSAARRLGVERGASVWLTSDPDAGTAEKNNMREQK